MIFKENYMIYNVEKSNALYKYLLRLSLFYNLQMASGSWWVFIGLMLRTGILRGTMVEWNGEVIPTAYVLVEK